MIELAAGGRGREGVAQSDHVGSTLSTSGRFDDVDVDDTKRFNLFLGNNKEPPMRRVTYWLGFIFFLFFRSFDKGRTRFVLFV